MKKNRGKLQFFIFRKIFAPLEAKMMKHDLKKDKKMNKTRGTLQFSIFWKIFAPLEAKMMKHDKAMMKNDKHMKKKPEKIAIFLFFENFCTTGSKIDEK